MEAHPFLLWPGLGSDLMLSLTHFLMDVNQMESGIEEAH
jgi:hypothetical protein